MTSRQTLKRAFGPLLRLLSRRASWNCLLALDPKPRRLAALEAVFDANVFPAAEAAFCRCVRNDSRGTALRGFYLPRLDFKKACAARLSLVLGRLIDPPDLAATFDGRLSAALTVYVPDRLTRIDDPLAMSLKPPTLLQAV